MLNRLTSYRSGARSLLWVVAVIVVTTTVAAAGIATVRAQDGGEVMVSNMGEVAAWFVGPFAGNSTAVSFTTGTSTVALQKVQLRTNDWPPFADVSIFSDDSGEPGTKLHTLTNPPRVPREQLRFFTSSGFLLSTSSTYWLVIHIPCDAGLSWLHAATATSSLSAAQPGWSLGETKWLSSGGDGWYGPTRHSLGRQPPGLSRTTEDDPFEHMMLAVYASATSTASTSTATSTPNNSATGTPAIWGIPEVGQSLFVGLRCEIFDEDGLGNLKDVTFQWLADGLEVEGATKWGYAIQPTDVGQSIKVRVSFTDDLGNAESLTSEATDAVVQPLTVTGITATSYAENGTSTVATYEVIGAATSTTITWSLTGPDSDDFSISSSGFRVAHRLRHGQHVPRDRERRRR